MAGYADHVADLATRTIILDDDNNDQNDAVSNGPDEPYPYPTRRPEHRRTTCAPATRSPASPACCTTRSPGSTRRRRAAERCLAPPSDRRARRTRSPPTNPRPAAVDDVGGRVKVAAFNVLNYFTTIDTTSSSSSGPCGPLATLDCRGADSAAELARQRAKEVVAIGALDADVVGLVELQNDDGTAVRDLVAGLNARPGAAPYTELATGVDRWRRHQGHVHLPGVDGDAGRRRSTSSTPPTTRGSSTPATARRSSSSSRRSSPASGSRRRSTTSSRRARRARGRGPTGDDPDLLDGQGNCSDTRTERRGGARRPPRRPRRGRLGPRRHHPRRPQLVPPRGADHDARGRRATST